LFYPHCVNVDIGILCSHKNTKVGILYIKVKNIKPKLCDCKRKYIPTPTSKDKCLYCHWLSQGRIIINFREGYIDVPDNSEYDTISIY